VPIIKLHQISKIFSAGGETVQALNNVNLEIEKGEFVAIVGPSGSGKSTLLHLIGGLDKPSEGEITVGGIALDSLKDRELSRYRSRQVGFIFQDFHLQPNLTITENVEVPLMFADTNIRKEATLEKKARELLATVGLKDRLHHKPNQVSGGQKQRVAIARALINRPKIVLADEPTGNLDSVTAKKIITLLKRLHKEKDVTMIVVTHDREIARYAERIIEIKDGKLIEQNSFSRFTR
jgi:putative ABC transport system ATP-binding protein